MNAPVSPPPLLRLSLLLQLEKRARAATRDELAFLIANETFSLVPYRQALLWRGAPHRRVTAVSGLSAIDRNAPMITWLNALFSGFARAAEAGARTLDVADAPASLRESWADWLPARLIWLPLGHGGDVLVLAREHDIEEGERQLLGFLCDAYGHALAAQERRGAGARALRFALGRRRLIGLGLAGLAVLLAFLPVPQTALAPAEIVPRDPVLVRAPLEGVVDRIAVKPNQQVAEGDLLFNLDDRRLRSQLDVAGGTLQAAELELRQARQLAVVDQKVRSTLPLLQGKYDQQAAEIAYLRQQLARIQVRAPRAGVVVLDDPNEWLGRPVAIGEKVMLVADPAHVEVQARLSVADAIRLAPSAPLRLFLNIAPERPLDAVLTQSSYQATQGPDGILSYRLKARLDGGEVPRIGLKGTARVYGEHVPLAYALFRRPFAALRQWTGL
ncbi:HlyD family efflux transporter periplasmic adaptor subunit [Bosea sp. (in: a-proteobacteria)]|uniref:efflux RND transporter periplasmic adaptor subunit n=1 Tax=Bosea sp. (in: a-proteobacteria) TaxID=1871050 RepID=UPI0026111268|nr:HlyD family efflux transporter periplasmic adaptor subunit [Bosea sp. (in: a-proteobacteria)]MCO5090811.1 HlyD family efflux transporter periplasmic adaptor subunit [Bosea sp. (in: a-proteobacteria)]